MTETANPHYAAAQLDRAIDTLLNHADADVRARAARKVEAWRAVVAGMADGTLRVGSRTPVRDTPAWVTLEVAHGGFATGRYSAEGDLQPHEHAVLGSLRGDAPGTTDRERLNLHYLSDAGRAELLAALRDRRVVVQVPEEGALLVAAWLIENDRAEAALDLVAVLRPLFHRLRFCPRLADRARPPGSIVHVASVGEIRSRLRTLDVPPRIAVQNETLSVWLPLRDRLVTLWLETVEGAAPHLVRDGDGVEVAGGWPCAVFPTDWAARRRELLADYRAALGTHRLSARATDPRGTLQRLLKPLERCVEDSRNLSGRDVGRIRRTLADATQRRGTPDAAEHVALRRDQARIAALPTRRDFGQVAARRLRHLPSDGGLPSLELVAAPITAEEANARLGEGTAVPESIVRRAARALEAPLPELMERGLVASGEVLARVLTQVTAQALASGIDDPDLRALFAWIYAAFRRRRSLLLLGLEHQVRIDELPWVTAIAPLRSSRLGARAAARQTMEEAVILSLTAFPQTMLPNPLVAELRALAKTASLDLPLLEEVAADIFMGTFTEKWRIAAARASGSLEGSLYARYYDLPAPSRWAGRRSIVKWGRKTAADVAALCRERAKEVEHGAGSWVAGNGAVLEQSQILTTQNLVVLVDELGLHGVLRPMAGQLATDALAWVVRRHRQLPPRYVSRLRMVKNTAYAWRQAIYFLSLAPDHEARRVVTALETEAWSATGEPWAQRLLPAITGLRRVIDGERFDERGRMGRDARRFLGWSVGPHPMLGEAAARS